MASTPAHDLPEGTPAPPAVRDAAGLTLAAHFGPAPPYGSHDLAVGPGVASGPGAWTFRVTYVVDPDHASQYDKSTSYEGLAVLQEVPTGLRVVGGTLVVQDNGTNYFHRPGTRVPLLDLGAAC